MNKNFEKPANYPFYFFGAGVIRYFEYGRADVHIKFLQAPSKEDLRRVMDMAPDIVTERRGNFFERPEKLIQNNVIWACNDKLTIEIDEPDDLPDDVYAGWSKEIEDWLLAVHEFCPIETATRDNCSEPGQKWNRYSPWHEESMDSAVNLLKYWQSSCEKTKYMEDMAESLVAFLREKGLSLQEAEKLLASWNQEDNGIHNVDEDDEVTEDIAEFNSAEAEITAAMPAPDFSGMSRKDIMTAYYETANHGLRPLITEGLTEGLKVYKAAIKSGENEDTNVSIDMNTDNGVMSLYYGEDECEGEPFYRYSIGATLKICAAMLTAADANFRQSISNWFEDAVPNISRKLLSGMEITLWVPDVGGDPYLEL